MGNRIYNILFVGKSFGGTKVAKHLESVATQYHAKILYFDITVDDLVQISDYTNEEIDDPSLRESLGASRPKLFKLPLERQITTALIQEQESRDKDNSLSFHDKLHRSYVLWNRIQDYLYQNRIDSVVFYCCSFELTETIVYQVAQTHDLDLLILNHSVFEDKFFSCRSLSEFGIYPIEASTNIQVGPVEVKDTSENIQSERHTNCVGTNLNAVAKVFKFLFKSKSFRLFNPGYIFKRAKHLHDAPSDTDYWSDPFANFFNCKRTAYFDFFANGNDDHLNNQRFVYFTLQPMSELLTEISINRYADQLLAIEQLSKLLPSEIKIIVKGNFDSEPDYLTPMFFHRFKRIPNVVRVQSCVNAMKLIEACVFIATVNSPLGWKALSCGKKVLVFGYPWYRTLPGTIAYDKDVQYKDISATTLDNSELDRSVQVLLSRSHRGQLPINSSRNNPNSQADENSKIVATSISDLLFERVATTFCDSGQAGY